MSDGDTVIEWPDGHRPEESVFHAVNELQIQSEPEVIWAWICRPDLWPSYYSNAKFIKHLGGPWPELELGSRFRWFSFGAFVTSEVVEYEPGQRIAWDAKVLGGRGYHGWVLQRQSGGHLRPHRGDPEGLGHHTRQAGAPADDGPPAPALARGPGQGRGRGRPAGSVADPAGPLNSEHGRHRRAPRATRRDP